MNEAMRRNLTTEEELRIFGEVTGDRLEELLDPVSPGSGSSMIELEDQIDDLESTVEDLKAALSDAKNVELRSTQPVIALLAAARRQVTNPSVLALLDSAMEQCDYIERGKDEAKKTLSDLYNNARYL